jgi:hypothetical protein
VLARISLPRAAISEARVTNLVEEETGESLEFDAGAVMVPLDPAAVVTLRLIFAAAL